MVVLAVRLIEAFVAAMADLGLQQLFGSVVLFFGYLNLAFSDSPRA
jgi:hypothetical protein